jgi:hypothetical protein
LTAHDKETENAHVVFLLDFKEREGQKGRDFCERKTTTLVSTRQEVHKIPRAVEMTKSLKVKK